ncbi:ribosomal protein S18-alanine N-acetyltransferase [Gemmobacter sp. JM10B15]|uniref:[Ribosomal protein bS18]-alanine N-acetyltransferase n=2 Tax=Gemmobacter denitrificans TaxID=3123040 RepID=A0ABU8BWL0_9RHOB
MTVDRMAALHAACFTTPRPWTATEIAALLADPLCFALTAPGGFLIGRAVAGEAEVMTLAVDPALRRQGIGADLLNRFLQTARNRGAETAFLEVSAANTAALALYARGGFAPSGCRKGYYVTPEGQKLDAIVMSRPLSAASD